MPSVAGGKPVGPGQWELPEEAFVVRSPVEIQRLLNALKDAHELVVVHFGARGEFVVSALLAVDPNRRTLLLDGGPDGETNARVVASPPLLVLSYLGGVRIQFRLEGAEIVEHEGLPALRVPFPRALGRFERREAFRVRIPRGRPVVCEVQGDEIAAVATVRVLDLSCTGAALKVTDALDLPAEAALLACRLVLETETPVGIAMEVRRVGAARTFSGQSERIVGTRFVGLSSATEMRIARYLQKLQREALRLGLEP